MLIVILVIDILIILGGIKLQHSFGDVVVENIGCTLIIVGILIGIILSIVFIGMIVCYPYRVDETLKMYQEENSKIELKVKETVKAYMNYEQETYKELVETADLTTLLVKYPELNSNELVKSEIELYKENNKQIKKLKEQKIYRPVYRWWLYFGK